MMGDQYNPHFSGYGGGWGGFGGWGGGLGGVGLFGLIGLNSFGRHGFDGEGRRHGHDCGCCIPKINHELIDSRFNELNARMNTNEINAHIGGVETRLDTFKDFSLTAFGDLKRENALLGKDIVIANCATNRNIDDKFARLQHEMDKGFCATMRECEKGTDRILAKLCEQEKAELRDEIAELRAFRNSKIIAEQVVTNVRATTVGSNFNTGVQTQSNNSGQIVG